MNTVAEVEQPWFTPNESKTSAGSHTSGGKSFGVGDVFIWLFRGPRTTTTMLVVDEGDDLTPTVAEQLNTIKGLAALTDEEIAGLLGTTRQTLHNWRAGKKISARREQRLEKTLEAIQSISAGDADQTRRLLMAAGRGQMRIYDQFAEGSIESALAAVSGKPMPKRRLPSEYPIATQMGLVEDRAPTSEPKINRRFSKRL